jgi:hypothetical protein
MLKRLTWLPERDPNHNGTVIAGQEYDNVDFIGGNISNVTLTNVTASFSGPIIVPGITSSGVGSATSADTTAQPAIFTGGASPTAGNLYGIAIIKTGYEEGLIGINKNSITGSVPASALYISTYNGTGQIALGRGNTGGLPNSVDLLIGSTGNVSIANNLNVTGTISASNLPMAQTTSGTTNRITVTNGSTNPVIDIAATYVGQSSITTTGTLTTGAAGTGFTLNFGQVTQTGSIGSTHGGAGSVTGIMKANGSGTVTAASSGTDYAPATSGSSLLYGNGAGGFNNATIGTGLSFSGGTLTNTGGAAAFTKTYVSTSQTITAAGSLTLAHSLGATPTLLVVQIVNSTGELGYSSGDKLFINSCENADTNIGNYGVSVVPDGTNLNVRFGSQATGSLKIIRKDTGATASITNANWAIVFGAYAP